MKVSENETYFKEITFFVQISDALFSKAKKQIGLASNCNENTNCETKQQRNSVKFNCLKYDCQNAGPVSQTEEGVTISETLSNHRALNCTG